MSFLDKLLAGGPDYKVTADIGGAVFGPVDGSKEALDRFQPIAEKIRANNGLGYDVVDRLTHRSSDYGNSLIDRLIINKHK